jgi:hypothetical protein
MLEDAKWKWHSRVAAILFITIGLGGLISSLVQRHNEKIASDKLRCDVAKLKDQLNDVQKKLNEKQNANVGLMSLTPRNWGQELKPHHEIQFDVQYVVTGNMAKNFRPYQEIFSMGGAFDNVQARKAHSQFAARAALNLDFRGEDRTVGAAGWKTLTINLTGPQVEEVLAGTRTVYIMARVEWNNPSGSDDHFEVCKWLQKPTIKYLTIQTSAWHDCNL